MEIKMDPNPYKLDKVDGCAALTRKNAAFVEGIVNLDSNYAKDLAITPPDKKFDLKEHSQKSGGLYCGSTAYWFNEMIKPNSDFRTCVLGAVVAMDRTNSTHLESAINGRQIMRDIICNNCKDVSDLIKMLEVPFKASDKNHLISLLTKGIPDKKGGERCNLSFATKFCAYASIFLKAKIEYSKYDNVVSSVLPTYVKLYLNEKRKRKDYDKNGSYQHHLDVYELYFNDIGRILDKVKDQKINRDDFDHILWYSNKG